VQVFVAEIHLLRAGAFIPVESFIPMNLRWDFGSETSTRAEVFADGISPEMGIHCNLARIIEPGKRVQVGDDHPGARPEQTVMCLITEMDPNNRCNVGGIVQDARSQRRWVTTPKG
jgi:hypothetical protein